MRLRRPRFRAKGPIATLAAGLLATGVLTLAAPTAAHSGTPSASATPSATGEFDYAEALQDSMLFYESQRSGPLPADNRVLWRGPSDLTDGSDHGLDLTGGYHDAGDEVKFGLPEAYSMTALAWGAIDDKAGYQKSGQWQYLERNLRWGDDYIIKAHPSAHVFYGQVGDGSSDHSFWGPAEVNPEPRLSYAVTESCPGSDLVGQASAAMAASSIVFQTDDPTYSAKLLAQAKSLYEFADDYRGKYDACITGASGFYTSFSGYWDELVWGALWLYKATGDTSYLTKAETYFTNLAKANQTTTPEYAWTISWDDSSYASYVLLAEITGQQQYIDDAERNLDWFTTGYNGQHVSMSPGGEAQVDVWGTARYSANEAYLALDFENWLKAQSLDPTRQATYHDFAVRQMNYILGDNPNKESYEVGFTNGGTNTAWPQQIHNRTAHDSWDQSMSDPANTRHLDYGLLVGGPTSGDGFTDSRQNYQQTEGALDYNALFSGALAEMTTEYGGTPRANFPPTETPDGPEEFMQASPNQAGSNFIEIKAEVVNKSGWPARHLTNGSFRYYFTLDAGETASQLQLTSPYNQCNAPGPITQYSGSHLLRDDQLRRRRRRSGRPVAVPPRGAVPHHLPGGARLHQGLVLPRSRRPGDQFDADHHQPHRALRRQQQGVGHRPERRHAGHAARRPRHADRLGGHRHRRDADLVRLDAGHERGGRLRRLQRVGDDVDQGRVLDHDIGHADRADAGDGVHVRRRGAGQRGQSVAGLGDGRGHDDILGGDAAERSDRADGYRDRVHVGGAELDRRHGRERGDRELHGLQGRRPGDRGCDRERSSDHGDCQWADSVHGISVLCRGHRCERAQLVGIGKRFGDHDGRIIAAAVIGLGPVRNQRHHGHDAVVPADAEPGQQRDQRGTAVVGDGAVLVHVRRRLQHLRHELLVRDRRLRERHAVRGLGPGGDRRRPLRAGRLHHRGGQSGRRRLKRPDPKRGQQERLVELHPDQRLQLQRGRHGVDGEHESHRLRERDAGLGDGAALTGVHNNEP